MTNRQDEDAAPARPGLAVGVLVYLIELYRHMISPMRLPTCRFTPTCSSYAVEALVAHGLFRGTWLTAIRLAKGGPWHRGGWDPIPEPAVAVPESRRGLDDRNEFHV